MHQLCQMSQVETGIMILFMNVKRFNRSFVYNYIRNKKFKIGKIKPLF